MYEVFILKTGYSSFTDRVCRANSTSTLIKGPNFNAIVDTLSPWDTELLVQELKFHNVKPKDVNYCICTHGHSDHVGNNNLFLNARHIVGKSICFRDEFDLFPYFETDGYKIDGEDLVVFATPGHVLDHVSVKVTTKNGTVVVAGDLFEHENDNEHIWNTLVGSQDPVQQRIYRKKVLEMADFIIPGHGSMFSGSKI